MKFIKKIMCIFIASILIFSLTACDNKTTVENKITCSFVGWTTEQEKDYYNVSVSFNTNDLNYLQFTKIQFLLMKNEKSVIATITSEGQQIIKLLEWYKENWPIKVGNLTISAKIPNSSEYSHNDMWTYSNFDISSTSANQPKIIKAIIETESTRYINSKTLEE